MQKIWREDVPLSTNPLRFVLFASGPHRLAAITATACVVIGSGLNAFIPYLFKNIIDAATKLGTSPESVQTLWMSAIVFVILSFVVELAFRASGFVGMFWVLGVRATIRYSLSAYALRHSHDYFSNRFAGSISTKIGQAASSGDDLIEAFLWDILTFIITILTSFIIAFIVSPTIAFIFLAWILVIVPLNYFRAVQRAPLAGEAQKAETVLSGATVDFLTNITAVHEFARRTFESTRIKDLIARRRAASMRNWIFGEKTTLLNNTLQVLFVSGMIFFSIYLATKGVLTAGDIILVLSIIIIVQDRLMFLGSHINRLAEMWGTIKESLEDILIPHDIKDKPDAHALEAKNGGIELKKLSFSYGHNEVFKNLSLSIPPGQRIGLVGRSGSGKSTLMKLLLRHYDLSGGSILIDSTSIADVTKESLREHIAVVPQEPMLFHRSIKDNIAYGNPGATEEEIIEASKLAQADEFIRAFPGGYDVLVGERGVKLSGGQRQRIAIARALIKDAPVLLLDEATSALDSESEVLVQKALLELMKGRTVIAIAHRLSTLRAMDRILVLDDGKIIEDGTHEELLKSEGLYASLWAHQSGGYLKEDGEEGEK